MKNKKTLIIILSILIALLIALLICFLIYSKNKGWQYKLIVNNYEDKINIYKMKDNKIYVEGKVTYPCQVPPCPKSDDNYYINYSDSHMKVINDFINSFFSNQKENTKTINREELTLEQIKILDSIVDKYEPFLDSNYYPLTSSKYTIVTDSVYRTKLYDGGSYEKIYYDIDLEKSEVSKINYSYHAANLNRFSEEETFTYYTITIDEDLLAETKELIYDLLNKEDKNETNNHYCYYLGDNKEICNINTVNKIKELLNKFDKMKRQLLFKLEGTQLKCPSSKLYVYNDNTYEYYYTHSSSNKEIIPKTGEYQYNINYIFDSDIAAHEVSSGSVYAYTDASNKVRYLENIKTIDDFLKEININVNTCTIEQP